MTIRGVGRTIGWGVKSLVLIWLLTVGAVLALSWMLSDRDASAVRADAIICLGAGLSHTHPLRPGPASLRRALNCADLYHAGVADVVVFTGAGNSYVSAARSMATVAIREGVPPEAVMVDRFAGSTLQNAAFGLALLPDATDHVVIVSDAFHLPRSWVIFRAFGVDRVDVHAAQPGVQQRFPPDPETGRVPVRDNVQPSYPSNLDWKLREAFAIWLNVLRGAAYLGGGLIGIDHDTRIGWFN